MTSTTSSSESTYSGNQGHYQKPKSSTGTSSSHSNQASKSQHLSSGKTTIVNDFLKHFLQTKYYSVFTETVYLRHRSKDRILNQYRHSTDSTVDKINDGYSPK
jgi:hypothetical protein